MFLGIDIFLEKEMLCQICGEEEATFHLKEIEKGVVRSFHVCEVCAKGEANL